MSVSAEAAQHGTRPAWRAPLGLATFWLALAAAGAVAFFWDGFVSLRHAWVRPEYSYGPMVPLITAYMVLREIHHRPITASTASRVPGLVVLGLGLGLGLLGNLSHIPDFVTYGLITTIGGIFLVIAGARQGLRFWPAWVHLFFMLPLPNILYWQVSTKLQLISSKLGVEFISMAGVPVLLDGNVIDLGVYRLLVAEACNGLRYLFPLFSFGWLFAVLYTGPRWHRVVLFLSTVPVTIFMNSFRIGVIGVLVDRYGISQAEGFLHFFEGWIIFLACTFLLYIEAWVLHRFFSGRKRSPNILDIDYRGIIGPLHALRRLAATPALIAAAVAIIIAGVAWQTLPDVPPSVVDRRPFRDFPMVLADWSGNRITLDESVERVLAADDYFQADYLSGEQEVNLFMTFYDKQTEGSGIHSPEVCIPGGGWEVSQWTQRTVPGAAGGMADFAINRAVIRKDGDRRLVYYWFEQRGRRMTNDVKAKLVSMTDTVLTGRSDGGLVRLMTPILPDEPPSAADDRLLQFITLVEPQLTDFFPGRN